MITYVALAVLAFVLVWRVGFPGMELPDSKKTEETPAKKNGNIKYILLFGVLVIGGAVLFYFMDSSKISLSLESPSLQTISAFAQKYWFPIFFLYGVLALTALIALNTNPERKVWSGTVQKILAGVMLALFVVAPIGGWIMSPSSTSQNVSRSETTLAKMLPRDAPDLPRAWKQDGTLTDTFKWPRVEVPPVGDSVHVPGILDGHVVWVWNGNVRGLTIRCVHDDKDHSIGIVGDESKPCHKDGVVESYMHNEGSTAEEASYAYASRFEK